jgi:hypothetical protein
MPPAARIYSLYSRGHQKHTTNIYKKLQKRWIEKNNNYKTHNTENGNVKK